MTLPCLLIQFDIVLIGSEKVWRFVLMLVYPCMEIGQRWVVYYIRILLYMQCSPFFAAYAVEINAPRFTRTCDDLQAEGVGLMQPSMANLNSPSSRVVKDSTPFRRRILRCKNFGKGESWLSVFLDVVNLYLMKFWHRWILNERTFYSFILLFIWKWILT